MKNTKGFTLIELLAVMAIISLLSSIVFASVNVLRGKSADAAVKTNLANLRAQAEILYSNNGFFDIDTTPTPVSAGACVAGGVAGSLFADPIIDKQITSAANASTGGIYQIASVGPSIDQYTNTGCVVGANAASWAVSVPLKLTATNSWCVDSTGVSRIVTPDSGDRGFNGSACK